MNSEKFSLKWNDFQQTVSSSFKVLRSEQDFFDVTLVSDDEVHMSSHKLVLSACSDFFKSILKKTSNPHPLIYLSGISSKNLSFVIDYIYQGEVEIHQEQLNDFMNVAQKLKIAGLNSDLKEEMEDKAYSNPVYHQSFDEDQNINCKSIKKSSENVAKEQTASPNTNSTVENTNSAAEKFHFPLVNMDTKELDLKILDNIDVLDAHFVCKICGKTSNRKNVLQSHIETHIEGLSFPCQHCGKSFRSRNSLTTHTIKFHKN